LVEASDISDVVVVANGGTTAQLVPVVLALATYQGRYEVINVQRDGVTTVFATRGPMEQEYVEPSYYEGPFHQV
jgi:hypothetical protein